MPITTVPRTPEFVKGVINLRGKVIPVMDLRLKFGMDAIEYMGNNSLRCDPDILFNFNIMFPLIGSIP